MLIKNIIINTTSQGYLFLLSFFTTPFILARLGSEKYGILAIITALTAQLSVFDFGAGAALTKKIAELRELSNSTLQSYLKTAIVFYLSLAFSIGAFVLILSPFLAENIFHLPPFTTTLFRIAAINIALYLLTIYTDAIFQGWEKFNLYNLKTIIVGTANTAGAALILWAGYDLKQILLLNTTSLLITLCLNFLLIFNSLKINPLRGYPSKTRFRQMISFGIFKSWGNSAEQANFHLPKFFIANLVGVEQVPFFTIPLSLVQKTGIILSQISLSVFPNISYLEGKREKKKIKTIFLQGEILILLLMIPFLIVGLIWGEKFLEWWLKDPFFARQTSPVLSLLIITFFLRSLSVIPATTIEGLGNTKLPAFFVTLKMIVTLSLGPFIIAKTGAVGAGWLFLGLTLITAPSFLFVSYQFLKRKLGE